MKQLKYTSLLVAVAAALGLAACGERSGPYQADQKSGPAVDQAEQRSEQAKEQTRDAAKDPSARIPGALSMAVPDSEITAAVKAELAKDEQLGTLKIDVTTANGKVALTGAAPSAVVRDHATQVALAVKGVAGVDNQLVVGTS